MGDSLRQVAQLVGEIIHDSSPAEGGGALVPLARTEIIDKHEVIFPLGNHKPHVYYW